MRVASPWRDVSWHVSFGMTGQRAKDTFHSCSPVTSPQIRMGVFLQLRVGWSNLVRVSLIFASVSCYSLCFLLLMYFISKNFWFTIHVDSWFWRIIDQICWACAIFHSIPNLQACTDGQTDRWTDRQTDGQTDELIRVELGNAMVPPGKISWLH